MLKEKSSLSRTDEDRHQTDENYYQTDEGRYVTMIDEFVYYPGLGEGLNWTEVLNIHEY
jgi:hypothetical protein